MHRHPMAALLACDSHGCVRVRARVCVWGAAPVGCWPAPPLLTVAWLISVPAMEDIYGRAELHPTEIDVQQWLAEVGATDGSGGFGVHAYDVI